MNSSVHASLGAESPFAALASFLLTAFKELQNWNPTERQSPIEESSYIVRVCIKLKPVIYQILCSVQNMVCVRFCSEFKRKLSPCSWIIGCSWFGVKRKCFQNKVR